MKLSTFATCVVVLGPGLAAIGCTQVPEVPVEETVVPVEETVEAEPYEFIATAYCLEGRTQSGVPARAGIVAADPAVLPVGSIVRIDEPAEHSGIYSVLDTGGAIKGERLDIYLPDCGDAREFGRQPVSVRVLRHGWDPQAVDGSPETLSVE